jgi:hypothetical protein
MARDPRQYARIAIDMPVNRKLKGAPAQTKWLAVVGVLWSTQNLSDGEVEPAVIAATAGVPARHVRDLVNRDVWHEKGHACGDCPQPSHEGEVVIHDYLVHQDSAETIRQARAEKAKAGRAANHIRWKHAGPVEECPKCSEL